MRVALLTLALSLCALPLLGQARVEYELAFPNAAHHEARVTARFSGLPAEPLELRMSRSSPGRYALHEFAKNVYDVEIEGAGGGIPAVSRSDPHGWTVSGHGGEVTVRYTLFGDHLDGTYAAIDATHAHLNMPASLMVARGLLEEAAATVRFHPPEGSGWRVATQLVPTADPYVFTAPDLRYLLDSPAELSDFELREWPASARGRDATIRLAVHHLGSDEEVDRFAELAARVVEEQAAVFDELPAFDHGTYTFIADYLPWARGDAMEHRNSTVLTSPRPLATHATRNLVVLSHELFHAWSMERLRAAALEPFDFDRANPSTELWFGEGFTNYYDGLVLKRAGVYDLEDYAADLAGTLNATLLSPATRHRSVAEMSLLAPFRDAATSIDPTNFENTFLSYYTWGDAIGLGLDLILRQSHGSSLDAYMRALWERHGRSERPYTMADLRSVLAELTGDHVMARRIFDAYIEGRELFDYEGLLAAAGLLLRRVAPDQPWLGPTQIAFEPDGALIAGDVYEGSPLYDAGLDTGDRLLRLADIDIVSAAALRSVLAAHAPGDALHVVYEQRGRRVTGTLTLAETPILEVVPFERAGLDLTDDMRAFREAWLGPRAR